MRPDDGVADGVALAKLDLDPLAQRREHLGEDDLEMSGCLKSTIGSQRARAVSLRTTNTD